MVRCCAAAVLAAAAAGFGQNGLAYTFTYDDPLGLLTPQLLEIESHLAAAANAWAGHLFGTATIDVLVIAASIGGTSGRALSTSFVGGATPPTYEMGMYTEIHTGIDPNGAGPDVEITIDPAFLESALWFDPDPAHRTAPVPPDKIDAMPQFIHEMGHALVFNGWRDGTNGVLPGNYQSTFDEDVSFNGADLYFNGPLASGLYGGPVPLMFGSYGHLGNFDPRPGESLLSDLMNGFVFDPGVRYFISPIDLAICKDTGIEVVSPCYPDCNGDGALNLSDFGCFQTKFALADPYADCNGDVVLNLSDFGCFQTKYALGCP
jgi:hypothetical protein